MKKDLSYKIVYDGYIIPRKESMSRDEFWVGCSEHFQGFVWVNKGRNSWDGPSGDTLYSRSQLIKILKDYIKNDNKSENFETTSSIFEKIISEMSDNNSVIIYYD